MPTAIRAGRRVDIGIKEEGVSVRSRRSPARRPPDAVEASEPESTSRHSQSQAPAAHEK